MAEEKRGGVFVFEELREGPCYAIMWTPWRMKYIEGHTQRRGCVFCMVQDEDDREALILYRGKYNYIILNKYPYNTAHTMVVPYKHTSTIEDLSAEELSEAILMIKAVIRAIREEYKPHGFNIGMNMGEAAGAGIAGHVHFHIVPRWCGDTNYTYIIGGMKLVPEALERTYERLKPRIEEACREICSTE